MGSPWAGERMLLDAHHQGARFELRLDGQRNVHRHLVTVEVGVERGAHERVQLDSLALDQDRLEGLDAEAVKRRRAVQHDRVLANDFFENIPDFRAFTLHQPLRSFDGRRLAAQLQLGENERLEQLKRHLLRQAALVQLERRADHDDRTARVVDALAEQVLAEASLLTLDHIGKRLQRDACSCR